MKLDEKDIEAIAKSRVSRQDNNKSNYWMVGSVMAIVGGVFIVNFARLLGWGVAIAGFATFILYMNNLSKKQNLAVQQLLGEWRAEQTDNQGQVKG
jgi:hypothetical protein